MKRLALTLVALLALVGCAKDDLQGDVTGKDVKAGYDFVYMQPIYGSRCTSVPTANGGTTMSCTQYVSSYIPIVYHVPTCYRIEVKGDTSGKTCLSEGAWEDIAVGDYYEGPDVDPKDRKVKK